MKALLLAAHGSRLPNSNEEVRLFARELAAASAEYDLVEHAFLELTGPSIVDAADVLVAAGALEIVIVPYFLAAGRHVSTDFPEAVAAIEQHHPDIAIRLTPHLGAFPGLAQLVLQNSG